MIKRGDAIYMDSKARLFGKPGDDRFFLGWSHDDRDMEEGTMLLRKANVLIDKNGFGMERKEEDGDYNIRLP